MKLLDLVSKLYSFIFIFAAKYSTNVNSVKATFSNSIETTIFKTKRDTNEPTDQTAIIAAIVSTHLSTFAATIRPTN